MAVPHSKVQQGSHESDACGTVSRPSGFHRKEPARTGMPVRHRRARWAVIEHFVLHGFQYRLVRRPFEPAPPLPLTKREREVVEYASKGHSNKSIAYTLGLAPSTVGVFLHRAAVKLGVDSRADLLSAYARVRSE